MFHVMKTEIQLVLTLILIAVLIHHTVQNIAPNFTFVDNFPHANIIITSLDYQSM